MKLSLQVPTEIKVQRVWQCNVEYASPAALSGLYRQLRDANAMARGQKLTPLKESACIGRISSLTSGGKEEETG